MRLLKILVLERTNNSKDDSGKKVLIYSTPHPLHSLTFLILQRQTFFYPSEIENPHANLSQTSSKSMKVSAHELVIIISWVDL